MASGAIWFLFIEFEFFLQENFECLLQLSSSCSGRSNGSHSHVLRRCLETPLGAGVLNVIAQGLAYLRGGSEFLNKSFCPLFAELLGKDFLLRNPSLDFKINIAMFLPASEKTKLDIDSTIDPGCAPVVANFVFWVHLISSVCGEGKDSTRVKDARF